MKEQEKKTLACATGARKDVLDKHKLSVELAMTQCVQGSNITAKGWSMVWDFYQSPNNNVHYNKEVADLSGGCDENSTIAGDMSLVGTQSMQDMLQGNEITDEENRVGTLCITKIRCAWPRAQLSRCEKRGELLGLRGRAGELGFGRGATT